jgi:hypothetical protein
MKEKILTQIMMINKNLIKKLYNKPYHNNNFKSTY